MLYSNLVGYIYNKDITDYPSERYYSPSENYPEYPFDHYSSSNYAYKMVRDLFFALKMDFQNFNTSGWNPLGKLIFPGQSVLLKPNFVKHKPNLGGDSLESLVTHVSVIRAVLDFVYIALDGQGTVIVGDAPVQSCIFTELMGKGHYYQLVDFYEQYSCDFRVVFKDFRKETCERNNKGLIINRQKQNTNSSCVSVNLGHKSYFQPIIEDYKRFRVANYNGKEMMKHHNYDKNEYMISRDVLLADSIISLPKLKTHRKAGITACLKNMVGINGSKDWLPHHRRGSKEIGQDEYLHKNIVKALQSSFQEFVDRHEHHFTQMIIKYLSKFCFKLLKVYKKDGYSSGSWYGNDTIWRMVLDLNRILYYADSIGEMQNNPQRKVFYIVDGIIAGDGEGPLSPKEKKCGVLLGGYNPIAIDALAATIMGFDYQKIPLIKNGFIKKDYPLSDFLVNSLRVVTGEDKNISFKDFIEKSHFQFEPSSGWLGYIEKSKI